MNNTISSTTRLLLGGLAACLAPVVLSATTAFGTGAEISLNQSAFVEGDTMEVSLRLTNEGSFAMEVTTFVVLEITGQFFFAPSYTESPVAYEASRVMMGGYDSGLESVATIPFGPLPAIEIPGAWYAASFRTTDFALVGDVSTAQFTLGEPISFNAGEVVSNDLYVGNMRYIPAGTFLQGSPMGEACRLSNENQFEHTLTMPFAIMETPVTRGMWEDAFRNEPGLVPDPSSTVISPYPDHPVQMVRWIEAMIFANVLSKANGFRPAYYVDTAFTQELTSASLFFSTVVFCDFSADGYRLPTEGEWEYAARAGGATSFPTAVPNYDLNTCYVCDLNVNVTLDDYGWYCGNAGGTTQPVGMKMPNAWNLHDMYGNVSEWCWDWYGSYPAKVTDYRGPSNGAFRVYRGGTWMSSPQYLRNSLRNTYEPGFPNGSNLVGFRLVRNMN